MDCSAVKPRMEALVNGSLPAPDRALAEQHISTCEGCRLELELVRAIGSQDQTQSGQAPPDWTLDRIFGPETAQGQGRPPQPGIPPLSPGGIPAPTPDATAAPEEAPSTSWERTPSASGPNPFAAAPEPSATVPSAPLPIPVAVEASEATPSWDFEPADAKGSVKPSEESLFFAEEALQRRNNPDKKASNFRVILWGAGGVVGAIVLALSSWFVLHMAPQSGDDSMRAAAAPPISSPQAGGESAGTAPVDPGANTPVPVPPPVSASSAGQPPPLPDAGRAAATTPTHSAPIAADQPAAQQSEPPAAPKPPAVSRRTSDPAGHHSSPKSSQPSAPAIKPSPEPVADETGSMDSGDAGASGADDAEPRQAVPAIPYAPRTGARTSALPPAHAGEPPSPQTAVSPAAGKPSEENAPPPEIHSPIERIHLATVAAAEQEDIAALRRLRSTWKTFMSKMGVGPDRARARREYADCLWAIQSLTARRGDQKDALAAYREYLLSAPAGGADSRSVSRLRQLEDALAEKH